MSHPSAAEKPEDETAAIQQVLEARARVLAQRSEAQSRERSRALRQALTLVVGEEQFALALGDVLQIRRDTLVTPLPGSPPELAGIANLRGAVYSIMDLGQILTGKPQTEQGWIVFLRTAAMRLGLLVGRVDSIVTYTDLTPLEAAPPHLTGMIAPGVPLINLNALLQHRAFLPVRKPLL